MMKKLLCATLALGSSLGLLMAADAFTGSWKLAEPRAAATGYTDVGATAPAPVRPRRG